MTELLTVFRSRIADLLGSHVDVVLPALAFVIAVGGIWLLARWLKKPNVLNRRLATPRPSGEEPSEGWFDAVAPALAAQLPESNKEGSAFRKLLRGAGLYSPKAITTIYALRFVLLFAPLVAAGAIAVIEPSKDTLRILLLGGLAAAGLSIIPRLYVFVRRNCRRTQIRQGLPDTMDMLAMCMDSGIGLSTSLSHVAEKLDSYPALAEELTILRRQAEVSSLKQALADFSDRVEMPEVRSLSALLSRGDRLGTQLSGSLLEQSDHMRNQRRQRAMLQANKTPVKLVLPLMFCFAPAALILLVSPAVIELKEFLAPSSGQSVLIDGDGLDTNGSIFDTLDRLDQQIDL